MIPTIVIPQKGSARLLLPYRPGNREIVERITGRRGSWNGERWRIRRSEATQVLEACVDAWGEAALIWYATEGQQQCDTRCAEAEGWTCRCSCGGTNHRGGVAGWMQVGSSTLRRHGTTIQHRRVYTKKEIAA